MKQWFSIKQVRFGLKPMVFLVCLIPLGLAIARARGLAGGLGTNPIESLMDHFGNTGLNFMLITLAITPFRKISGQKWLARFRRPLGLFAFFYILAHFLVYLILDQGLGAIGFIIEDIVKRPFITLGIVALLLLTAMAVTSTAYARRALGKRWQQLHYAAYLVAILGVWHYAWQVKKDLSEPLIYGLIVAALLGYRLMGRRKQAATRKLNPV